MFSLICKWINGLVNNREAGDLRRHRAHYDVTLMIADQTLNLQNTRHTSLLGLWGVYCKYYRTHWPYYNMSTMHIPQTTLGSRPAYSRVVVAQRDCCSSATSSSDCCTIYETPPPPPPPHLIPKYCNISLLYNWFSSWEFVSRLCTGRGSITPALCAKNSKRFIKWKGYHGRRMFYF